MEIPYIVNARKDTGLFNSKIAIWLFLASEVMLFGGFFSAYIFLRLGADYPWPERTLAGFDQHLRAHWFFGHCCVRVGRAKTPQLARIPDLHGHHHCLRAPFHGAQGCGIQREVTSPGGPLE